MASLSDIHSKHAQHDEDREVQQVTVSRRQGGKRVKAAAIKHPSPQRKQQALTIIIQPITRSKSKAIKVAPSSAFSHFVPSSSTSSSSAIVSDTASSVSTRSLSIGSATSTCTTIAATSPSLSACPLITPSSALATSLSSFTFTSASSSAPSLPSTLECSEELDDKSTSQRDEDDYVLVHAKDAQAESSTPSASKEERESDGWEEEEDDEAERAESEIEADDEYDEEPYSDDDTVPGSTASPDTISSLPATVSTAQSSSSSAPTNPSPCPLPSALITSYFTPDPRAYSLALSRSTESLSSIESILEPTDPDLLAHMFDTERLYHPLCTYMQHQPHLDAGMRPVLLDWMVEVSHEYGLQRETTQLAANFVDRFLTVCPASLYPPPGSSTPTSSSSSSAAASTPPFTAGSVVSLPITRLNFQLLGVTALFLASKLEEIYPPTAADFAKTTDSAYGAAHIAAFERVMLDKLHWRLQAVTPFAWCKAILKCACRNVAHYFDDELDDIKAGMQRMVAASRERVQEAQRLNELELLRAECISYLLSVDLFTRCMEFIDATLLDDRFLSFYPSALASAALLLVYSSPPASVCLDLLLLTTTYSLPSLLKAIAQLGSYSGMKWRGMKFPLEPACIQQHARDREDEKWSRQMHWPGMLQWKAQVEADECERYKQEADEADDNKRLSDLERDDDNEDDDERGTGRGGGLCVDVGESSLSSYGASGLALTSSLASTSEWSTLDSELDRRDC